MLAGSDGVDTIPQLHVNGKVRKRGRSGRAACFRSTSPLLNLFSSLPFSTQLVGAFNTCQEMEDFGELDAALKPKE